MTELDGPVTQPLPADGGRGFDLLHGRPTRGPGHEVEEKGVGPGQARLGHEHPGGPLLGVGEGDVHSHSPGAHGADLQVDLGPHLRHALEADLGMPDELGQVAGGQVLLHFALARRTPARALSRRSMAELKKFW